MTFFLPQVVSNRKTVLDVGRREVKTAVVKAHKNHEIVNFCSQLFYFG